MKKEAKKFLIMVLLILVVVFLLKENVWINERKQYSVTYFDTFDTVTEIRGYVASEELFHEKAEQINQKLVYYHQLFDIYHDYEGINNIKTINDNAGVKAVEVDKELIALLKLSREMYDKTEGKINIAMGSVLSIWHTYRTEGIENPETAALPSKAELKEAAEHMDINSLIIDEEKSTVYVADSDMSLDVGGIAKGYAVQRAAQHAREIGLNNALLSVGGNVYAIGNKIDDTSWKIGILNPNQDTEKVYIETVELKDCSIVTSGDYQRFYTVDGVNYCHIINPDTCMPADYVSSVSIITEDSGIADALSTAVFNMPLEEGMAFVNSMENVEAIWVLEDGQKYYSAGFGAD